MLYNAPSGGVAMMWLLSLLVIALAVACFVQTDRLRHFKRQNAELATAKPLTFRLVDLQALSGTITSPAAGGVLVALLKYLGAENRIAADTKAVQERTAREQAFLKGHIRAAREQIVALENNIREDEERITYHTEEEAKVLALVANVQ